ncbi:MAG: DEAD/DEAH box helicase [Bacteriovoracaceae bacterium]|nr:DEAD/DEAH box helicase [Bacteriovoracaceae bacterium]
MAKSFDDLLKNEAVLEFLKEAKFKRPTAVQEQVIPKILNNSATLASSPTGSGKTLSFALPIVEAFKNEEKNLEAKDGAPFAVILSPTRELSGQIQSVFKSIAHHAKFRVRVLSGGEKKLETKKTLNSPVDILVANPGRLLSVIKSGELEFSNWKYLICDEADQLFDMGFSKDLKDVWAAISKRDISTFFLTATRPDDLEERILDTFEELEFKTLNCGDKGQFKKEIDTFNVFLNQGDKILMLTSFLKEKGRGSGIVFVNRKEDIAEIEEKLDGQGITKKIYSLHGGMDIKDRRKTFREFKKKPGVLICSDIAARGIDIHEVSWVLNYDLPFQAVYYIHRCGRTSRGGGKGVVFNFVTPRDRGIIAKINNAIANQSALRLKSVKPPKENAGGETSKKKTKKKASSTTKKKVSRKAPLRKSKKTPRYKRK